LQVSGSLWWKKIGEEFSSYSDLWTKSFLIKNKYLKFVNSGKELRNTSSWRLYFGHWVMETEKSYPNFEARARCRQPKKNHLNSSQVFYMVGTEQLSCCSLYTNVIWDKKRTLDLGEFYYISPVPTTSNRSGRPYLMEPSLRELRRSNCCVFCWF
jgi:hypothetical protein